MNDVVNVNLEIPLINIKINLNLNKDDILWDIKQNILKTIATDLKDGLNHDFYQPSTPFKAAKFLDSERMLREYCLEDGANLQLIPKKRIYKEIKIDRRKLADVNSKSCRKKFIHLVQANSVKKVSKMLDRGLDPNFVSIETEECAMTMAAGLKVPGEMLITLVAKGAHIDLRNHKSLTALHKAAVLENYEAIKTLLSLGASPNYKDKNNLTPLYHSIITNKSTKCAELLLKDYALLGIVDEKSFTEIHQASMLGKRCHIDLLISYGADINVQDLHGNTPLHLAVKHQQMESASMLLHRGADRHSVNLLNQTPQHLASFYNFSEFSQLIESFNPTDIAPVNDTPTYNDKSRSTLRRRSQGNLMTLKKLSLSTPYLHYSVSNLTSPEVNPSVNSFEMEENSTGSADQQFEFDLNNDSRPSSWTKPSELPTLKENSMSTTPTSSLRDLHTPLKTHNRYEHNNIINVCIPEAPNESETISKQNLTSNDDINNSSLHNRENGSKSHFDHIRQSVGSSIAQTIANLKNNKLASSQENLEEEEYLNFEEIDTLVKKRPSLDDTKPIPKISAIKNKTNSKSFDDELKSNHFVKNGYNKHKFEAPKKTPFTPKANNVLTDTYLNSSQIDEILNSQPTIPSPHLLKPTKHLQNNKNVLKNFEKPFKNHLKPPKQTSPSFANIPPPPEFPKNFTKVSSPQQKSTFRLETGIASPPLPTPPSSFNNHDTEFAFPPPPSF